VEIIEIKIYHLLNDVLLDIYENFSSVLFSSKDKHIFKEINFFKEIRNTFNELIK
jgi:hypothetical protein